MTERKKNELMAFLCGLLLGGWLAVDFQIFKQVLF